MGVGQQEVPQRMVPAQAGLALLQHVKYVGLPQEGHDLVVVCWGGDKRGAGGPPFFKRAVQRVLQPIGVTHAATLTDGHHVLVLAPTGAAEGAGGAGHDGRVGLAGVVHHL